MKPVPFIVVSALAHVAILFLLIRAPLGDPGVSTSSIQIAALFTSPPEREPLPSAPVAEPRAQRSPERPSRSRARRASPRLAEVPETTSPASPQALATPTEQTSEAQESQVLRAALAPAPNSGSGRLASQGASPPSRSRRVAEPTPRRSSDCTAAARAVHSQLSRLPTPRWAGSLGVQGTVRLSLRVGQDGRARGVRVLGSSGNAALDRHIRDGARGIASLPACRRPIEVPVTLSLRGR